MSLKRIATIAFYAIVAIISLIGFYIMFDSSQIGQDPALMVVDETIQKGTGIVMWVSIVLVVIAIVLALIVAPVLGILNNPGNIKKMLISIGALLVLFFIGYAMAGDEVTPMYRTMGINTPTLSKLVGGILNATYILLFLSIAIYIYNTITSFIKQL